ARRSGRPGGKATTGAIVRGSVAADDGERPDTEHRVLDADDRATFESALDLLPALHEPAMQDARLSMTEAEDDDGWGVVAREREQIGRASCRERVEGTGGRE